MNILTPLETKLATYGEQHYETAISPSYPYIVWTFDISSTDYDTQVGQLTVNMYHNKTETNALAEIEALRSAVWLGLRNYSYNDSNVHFTVYWGINESITEPDINLLRRYLTFEILLEEE